jgi:hypothetical protein
VITNTGKNIISKYLIGQAPAYASYIAFGGGARPIDNEENLGDFSDKEVLDFELFRTPITSRGYVTDIVNGQEISKIVLTAELPPEQRYEITEIGLFSARTNPAAVGRDSRMLFTFTEAENWEYHNETTSPRLSGPFFAPLNAELGSDVLVPPINSTPGFFASSNNVIFSSDLRVGRFERCRYLNTAVLVPGNMSYIEEFNNRLRVKPKTTVYHGTHIHFSGININLDQNSAEDILKVAFSVVNKDGQGSVAPSNVKLIIEFASDDTSSSSNYARMEVSESDLGTSRYQVVSAKLGELQKSSNFSWSAVNIVKVYASVFKQGSVEPTSDFYVALDGIRLENVTSQNPLYGLTGYTIVQNEAGAPIIKQQNTSNIVEFRFGMDVQ